MRDISATFRARRRLILVVLAVLALIAGAAWVASLDVKRRIEAGLSEALRAQVRIRHLRWRALGAVTAEGIVAEQGGQRVAGLDRIHAAGSPWGLLRRRIVLDTLEIVGPSLHLRRDPAGRWNLPVLNAATDTLSATDASPRRGSPGWSLEIRHGTVRAGSASVTVGAAHLRVDSLSVDFGIRREGEGHALLLSRLNTLALSPPLVIRRIDAAALLHEDALDLSALDLETEASHLSLTGHVRHFADPQIDLALTSDRLSSDEVRRFLPAFPLSGSLDLKASLKGGWAGLDVVAGLDAPGGHLEGRGRLNLAATPMGYDLTLTTRGVDLSRLLAGPGALPTALNVSLTVAGTGLRPGEADLSASLVTGPFAVGGALFDSLTARLRMRGGAVDAEARGRAEGWGGVRAEGHIDLTSDPLSYRIDADVEGLDLAALTGDAALRSDLSGRVEVSGSGSDVEGLDLRGRLALRPSRIGRLRVDGVEAAGRYRGRILTFDQLVFRSPAGSGRATGRVSFPAGRPPAYGGDVEVSGLDLAALTGDSTLRSDLSATAELVGDGMREIALRVVGRPSQVGGVSIRRLNAEGGLRRGVWTVERFDVESEAGDVRASGTAGPSDSVDVRADVRLRRLPPVRGLDAALSGQLSGTLRGRLGDLRVTAAGRADSVRSGRTLLMDATFDLDLRGLDVWRPAAGVREVASGDVTVRIGSLGVSSFTFKDLIGGAHLTPGAADLAIDMAPTDWARIDAAGRVTFAPEGLVARLDTLFVEAERFQVRNDGPCHLRYAYGGGVRLDQLRVVQEGGALTASGEVDAGGRIQGEVRVEGIDLRRWDDLLGRRDGVSGLLGLRAVASGSLQDPEVSGSVEISGGGIADFAYQRLAGTFAYRGGVGQVDLRLDQGRTDGSSSTPKELTLRGAIPLSAQRDGQFDVRVRSDGLDLAFLQAAFPGLRDVKGNLLGDLTVSGTVARPTLSGFLEVPSGSLRVPDMGLRLADARLRLDAAPGRLRLSNLMLRTKGGSLSVQGGVSLDGLRAKDLDVEVKANAFDLLDRKDAQLNIGGTLRMTGTPARPDVTWDFTLLRALLPIPEEEGVGQTPSSFWDSPFIRGMACRGRLRIPRNAWVRSADFNAEVQGEIEVTKEGPGFILFGGLEAIRGQYIFQNARFSIERGELRFRGTPDNDPDLYLLGTRRIPRVLPDATGKPSQDLLISIVVGGTLKQSRVTLESDAPTPLDQADLLSYLLFGRPSSQTLLGSLGGGGSTANLQSQAQNLAFGIAANHLKQTVGRELGLDVLEVEVGQGRETLTHLAVGKYVRRDLLLTFSQDVIEAGGQGQDRLGRKVSVEYEFGRHFGLSGSVDDQKKTALDLFWKKEW